MKWDGIIPRNFISCQAFQGNRPHPIPTISISFSSYPMGSREMKVLSLFINESPILDYTSYIFNGGFLHSACPNLFVFSVPESNIQKRELFRNKLLLRVLEKKKSGDELGTEDHMLASHNA